MRLVLSLWDNRFSSASEALRLRSYVFCHALRVRHEYEYCDVCVNRSDDNMLDDNFQVSQRLTSDPTTTPQQCTKEIDNSPNRADLTISETCPQLATTQNEIPPLRGERKKDTQHTQKLCNTKLDYTSRLMCVNTCAGTSVLLRQSIQGLYCLVIHVVRPVVRLSVLVKGATEAPLSVIQQAMEFTQPRPYSFLLLRRCRRRVPCSMRWRGARGVVRSDASMISVTILDNLNLCLISDSVSCIE